MGACKQGTSFTECLDSRVRISDSQPVCLADCPSAPGRNCPSEAPIILLFGCLFPIKGGRNGLRTAVFCPTSPDLVFPLSCILIFSLIYLQIARVRQENIARQKRQQEELAAAQEEARRSSGGAASTPAAGSILLQGATLARTLKVTWDRLREGGVEDYGAEKLRKVFTQFGPVEDVIIKEDVKKKKKGTALVVLGTEGAAAAAIGSVCGDLSNPLLVKPAVPGMVPSAGQANAANGLQASGANRVQASGVNGEQSNGVNRGQTSGVDGHQTNNVNASQDGGVHRSQTSGVNGAQVGGKDGGASGEGEKREDIRGAGAAPKEKRSTSSDGGASQVCCVPDSPSDFGFLWLMRKAMFLSSMKCGLNLGARMSLPFAAGLGVVAFLVMDVCGYQYLLLGFIQPVQVSHKGKLSVAFGFSAP
jgi:hypothetical protein